MLKTICYQSNPKRTLTILEQELLLHEAKKNNDENGISGTLLFLNHSFFQIIEGEENLINSLYKKIKQDPRHKNIVELFNMTIKDRVFDNFETGYTAIDDLEILYGFNEYADLIYHDKEKNGELFLSFLGNYMPLNA